MTVYRYFISSWPNYNILYRNVLPTMEHGHLELVYVGILIKNGDLDHRTIVILTSPEAIGNSLKLNAGPRLSGWCFEPT